MRQHRRLSPGRCRSHPWPPRPAWQRPWRLRHQPRYRLRPQKKAFLAGSRTCLARHRRRHPQRCRRKTQPNQRRCRSTRANAMRAARRRATAHAPMAARTDEAKDVAAAGVAVGATAVIVATGRARASGQRQPWVAPTPTVRQWPPRMAPPASSGRSAGHATPSAAGAGAAVSAVNAANGLTQQTGRPDLSASRSVRRRHPKPAMIAARRRVNPESHANRARAVSDARSAGRARTW